ncbi:carboxypeptidase M32 [bacterium]|nr:carboxypeptidase M32 [bacterium]
MHPDLQKLRDRLREISDLDGTAALLHWDQATYMPPGGAPARGRQLSLLSRLSHERLTDPAIGNLLDRLESVQQSLPPDGDDARLLRLVRRQHQRAVRVPTALVAEIAAQTSTTYEIWTRARPANDFAAVRPALEQTLDLSRRLGDCYPGYTHPADPLIEESDYGMSVALLQPLFTNLRRELVPLVEQVTAQPPANSTGRRGTFPEAEQLAFSRDVVAALGYDFGRGRLDKTHHPFMTKFSLDDVRITTRVKGSDLGDALFSTIHEAGHALYEQGIRAELEGTPLGGGTSSGVHESQSRLWENIVGRSRGFWTFFYPRLQRRFPEQLGSVPLEAFHRAINRVERSLIRTEADEVTYNLHVMIRFDLELQLLDGRLAVRDLPEAWRARYQSDLGLTPPDNKDGVLQDVHWYAGLIGGAFQGYTLGNILAAQFYTAAVRARPEIPGAIARGEFNPLLSWLREHVHQHGSKFDTTELVERATGQPLTIAPYFEYLRTKFGELFGM